MSTTLLNYIQTYEDLHKDFFDFIVQRNVHCSSDDKQSILTHLINYSPSITLAQCHFYVFKNKYSISEVCELFIQLCSQDELFSRRTLYILLRYQHLGPSCAASILDKLCTTELVLYPLLSCRKEDVSIADFRNDDNIPLLSRNGECSSSDRFYSGIFDFADPVQLLGEFSQRRDNNDMSPTLTLISGLQADRDALILLNMLYWRYDGNSYVDSCTDNLVGVSKDQPFFEALSLSITNYARRLDTRLRPKDETNTSSRDTDRETGRELPKKKHKSSGNGDGDFSKLEQRIRSTCRVYAAHMSDTCRAVHGSSSSVATGCNGGNTINFVPGPTLERFVRYTDNGGSNRLMLNLYLNRFELRTPATSNMFSINYEDNPPYQSRYCKVRDTSIELFVQRALEHMTDYFSEIGSRDCINHYLYSSVIPARSFEEDEDMKPPPTKTTSASAANTTSPDSDINDTIKTAKFDKRFVCDVNDLLVLFASSLTVGDAMKILRSHIDSKRFTLAMINLAHAYSRQLLTRSDAAYNLACILTNSTLGDSHTLLYGPLASRSVVTKTTSATGEAWVARNINIDIYEIGPLRALWRTTHKSRVV